jgi:hypothetical protein
MWLSIFWKQTFCRSFEVNRRSFSNVVGGSPVQMTSALGTSQTQSMTIYAP